MQLVNVVPSSGLVEEVVFTVNAGTNRDSPIMDSLDWFGAKQSQFTPAAPVRQYGFPLLDLAMFNPGAANIEIRYQVASQTLPETNPPTLGTFTTVNTVAVLPASWGFLSGFRLLGRFSRINVNNPSAGNIAGVYLWHAVRSA